MKYLMMTLFISLIVNTSWAEGESYNTSDPNLLINTNNENPGPVLKDAAPTGAESSCCADKAAPVTMTSNSNPGKTSSNRETTTGKDTETGK